MLYIFYNTCIIFEFLDMPPCRQLRLAKLCRERGALICREKAGEIPIGPPFDDFWLFSGARVFHKAGRDSRSTCRFRWADQTRRSPPEVHCWSPQSLGLGSPVSHCLEIRRRFGGMTRLISVCKNQSEQFFLADPSRFEHMILQSPHYSLSLYLVHLRGCLVSTCCR